MRRARVIRIERALTQDDVAQQVGISSPALAQFEMGRNDLRASHLLRLAAVLDADPVALMELVPRPAVLPRVRVAPKTGGKQRAVAVLG